MDARIAAELMGNAPVGLRNGSTGSRGLGADSCRQIQVGETDTFRRGKLSQEIFVPQVGFERSADHGCQSQDEIPLATWKYCFILCQMNNLKIFLILTGFEMIIIQSALGDSTGGL